MVRIKAIPAAIPSASNRMKDSLEIKDVGRAPALGCYATLLAQ